MARYKPSQLIDSISGSLGDSTFTQWRGLNVVRRRVEVMRNPQTDKQTRARQNFTESSKAFSKLLSFIQREAWDNFAQTKQMSARDKYQSSTVPSVIPARSTTMSGFNRFVQHNTARATGTVNHQSVGEPGPGQVQFLPETSGGGIDQQFVPPQDHIVPIGPFEGEPNQILETPPTGIQPPGMAKILSIGISEFGTPGSQVPNFPAGPGFFNSPPAITPNFIHVEVEMPVEIEGSPTLRTGIIVPKDIGQGDAGADEIKGAVRLWKRGPESTGAYIIGTVPVVPAGSALAADARSAPTGGTVEFIFGSLPVPSNEASHPDPNQQSAIPPAPGLHEFQADVINDSGQTGPPSNEQKMFIGQPQDPNPESSADKNPFAEREFQPS